MKFSITVALPLGDSLSKISVHTHDVICREKRERAVCITCIYVLMIGRLLIINYYSFPSSNTINR